jgi:myo-inositol-hexaphosphate 3-phosphohydrolase
LWASRIRHARREIATIRRFLFSLLAITSIALTWHTVVRGALPTVAAVLETRPTLDDADADDPAIWVHPKDASRSLVLATLKEGGLDVRGSSWTRRKNSRRGCSWRTPWG